MEALKLIPAIVLTLTIAGVIIGATVISLGTFGDTMTKCINSSYAYNTTNGMCLADPAEGQETSGYDNFTSDYYTVAKGIESEITIAEQQSTVAIIAIMTIIISIIASVFVYIKYFG